MAWLYVYMCVCCVRTCPPISNHWLIPLLWSLTCHPLKVDWFESAGKHVQVAGSPCWLLIFLLWFSLGDCDNLVYLTLFHSQLYHMSYYGRVVAVHSIAFFLQNAELILCALCLWFFILFWLYFHWLAMTLCRVLFGSKRVQIKRLCSFIIVISGERKIMIIKPILK